MLRNNPSIEQRIEQHKRSIRILKKNHIHTAALEKSLRELEAQYARSTAHCTPRL